MFLDAWVYAGENPILRFDANGNIEYYLEDASDSIAALVDSAGVKQADYRYDGFGNNLDPLLYDDPTSSAGGDFGFHAAWLDERTGLYDMRARTYDPETGRFLTPDPVEPSAQFAESFNPYAFANNNPHLYSDPTGTFSITEISVTNAIDTGFQATKSFAVQQVKQRVIEVTQAAAGRLLATAFKGLLPIPQYLIEGSKLAKGIAGGSFESLLANGICGIFGRVLPQDLLQQFHFGPRIGIDGNAQSDGIGCPAQGLLKIPSGGGVSLGAVEFANPDYLIKKTPPTDDSSRAWLIGDIKFTVNTLYEHYVDPGKRKNQWTAMANYAKKHGYRIVMFFAYKKISEKGSELFEEILLKEGAGQGIIVLVASFDA